MKIVPQKCSILLFLMTLLLAGCGQKAEIISITHPPEIDIHSAVTNGDIASVRQHIDAGSNLDEPDSTSGNTPLMNAILFGQQAVGQLLIENGVKLDARSSDGSTALITAAFFGYPEMIRALLQKGADTTIQNNTGATALMSVQIPWDQAKPIYDFVGSMLQPIGVSLDYERIQKNRPIVVALLQAHTKIAAASVPSSFVPEYEVETKIPSGNEKYLSRKSDHIYDQDRLHTFELNLPGASLAALDADPTAEKYVEGSLTFEGETISPVGIRYKGSVGAWVGGTSGMNPFMPSGHKIRTKLSMKVKINWNGSDTLFYGLKKLQFHSQNLDPSQMRDRLGYWLFREMGVPAPRSVHARLLINGKFSGLYALTEQIDGRFARYHFEYGKGNLYKEIWPINSNGQAHDPSAYLNQLKTNEDKDPNVDNMLAFGSEIANASETELTDVITNRMDISEIMAFAVVDRAIKNDDGPFHWYSDGSNSFNHNYYWYEDPVEQKFHLIPWDMDVSFQNIKGDKNPVTQIADEWGKVRADCDPFNHGPFNIPQRSAACDKLTRGWSKFDKEYSEFRTQLLAGPLSVEQADARIDAWADQIRKATMEANEIHSDALPLHAWEQAVDQLKDQLAWTRAH
ncbi:CotH kinase family protein [bacterium]|nr:CotH kinase family protein [bacterium]